MKSTTTQVRGREPPALPPSLPEAASGSVPHPVCDGDGVEEHKHAEEGPAVAEAGGQDVLHPRTALHLQRAAAAAGSRSGQQRADGVRQGTLRAARTPPPQRAALQVAAAAAPPPPPPPNPSQGPALRPGSFTHTHTHARCPSHKHTDVLHTVATRVDTHTHIPHVMCAHTHPPPGHPTHLQHPPFPRTPIPHTHLQRPPPQGGTHTISQQVPPPTHLHVVAG